MKPTVTNKDTVIPLEERSTIVNDPVVTQETPDEQVAMNVAEVDTKNPAAALNKVAKSLPMMTIGALLGLIIIPILQLYIGWEYADACPVNPKIPKYLFVAGTVGIVSVILNQLRVYLAAKSAQPSVDITDRKTTITAATGTNSLLNSVITTITYALNIFMVVWFIFGCIWIFGVWNDVKYRPRNHPNFCQALVYRFAYISASFRFMAVVVVVASSD
ncbi:unnamed protein product [Adineta steineri]|uniref:Uncharacterized protein n=1 Tax=Adineta steineri TaxID=433720 RepID=A0A819WRI3_9BILA|nr:unnamed protein product [Adineta steineri]CAF4127719.1 unnamed protein product [Adineta steineri]